MDEKKPKFNRRKILLFTALASVPAFFGRSLFKGSESIRSIANKAGIDFNNLNYVKSFAPLESKTSTRFLLKLSKIVFRKKYSKGHNTRQFSDLSEYAPSGKLDLEGWQLDKLLEDSIEERERNTKNFYIRTEKPDQLNFELKTIKVAVGENEVQEVKIKDVKERAKDLGIYMLECAGNDRYSRFGLMSAAKWSGVTIEDLISKDGLLQSNQSHTHVLIEGFDESKNTNWNRFPGLVESKRGASWIFTLEELKKHKAFLATSMNGKDLTSDHGYPLRLVVPCFYGCASIKWLNKICFFTPNEKTPTVEQMREFSDRTNQTGVPKLYKDHRSPVIDLASLPVKVEQWHDNTSNKKALRIIGLTWGGVDHINPRLKIKITKRSWISVKMNRRGNSTRRKKVERVILEEEIKTADRSNPLSFSHWTHWWSPPKRGRYFVQILPMDESVVARRLHKKYYQRMIKV